MAERARSTLMNAHVPSLTSSLAALLFNASTTTESRQQAYAILDLDADFAHTAEEINAAITHRLERLFKGEMVANDE